jgi:hypothetical protein
MEAVQTLTITVTVNARVMPTKADITANEADPTLGTIHQQVHQRHQL